MADKDIIVRALESIVDDSAPPAQTHQTLILEAHRHEVLPPPVIVVQPAPTAPRPPPQVTYIMQPKEKISGFAFGFGAFFGWMFGAVILVMALMITVIYFNGMNMPQTSPAAPRAKVEPSLPPLKLLKPPLRVFHAAVRSGDIDDVAGMIDTGADVNAADETGMTALSIARERKDWKMARLLTSKGAKPH